MLFIKTLHFGAINCWNPNPFQSILSAMSIQLQTLCGVSHDKNTIMVFASQPNKNITLVSNFYAASISVITVGRGDRLDLSLLFILFTCSWGPCGNCHMLYCHHRDHRLWQKTHVAVPFYVMKNCGCACAGNAGDVFPATAGKRSRHASRHIRDARAVMHAGIAN